MERICGLSSLLILGVIVQFNSIAVSGQSHELSLNDTTIKSNHYDSFRIIDTLELEGKIALWYLKDLYKSKTDKFSEVLKIQANKYLMTCMLYYDSGITIKDIDTVKKANYYIFADHNSFFDLYYDYRRFYCHRLEKVYSHCEGYKGLYVFMNQDNVVMFKKESPYVKSKHLEIFNFKYQVFLVEMSYTLFQRCFPGWAVSPNDISDDGNIRFVTPYCKYKMMK